jgi:hypothetical protein
LFTADVLSCFTSVFPSIKGRRNEIKKRKEEEAKIMARE